MGFLDRLFGREPKQNQQQGQWSTQGSGQYAPPGGQPYSVPQPSGGASVEDEKAIARYKYLLRTAPPEDLERVHAEAFSKLSLEQRQMVLQRLSEDLPQSERPRSDSPQDLARSATRAEMQNPGYLQQSFGRPVMMGGGGFGSSMMGSIAGVMIGSMLFNSLMYGYADSPEAQESGDDASDIDTSDDSGDSGDTGADGGNGSDTGDSGDYGSDAGSDFASDSGGGDWGGGDFGGGDFGGGDFGGF